MHQLKDGKLYQYPAHSYAFLDRARTAIEQFKAAHDVQQLLISALMLRLGIEARLFEYIEAELPSEGRREHLMRISEYQATKLLARLTRLNPNAKDPTLLVFRPTDGGEAFGMRYTPVTESLAKIHGRSGELLHFNYFRKNPYWYIADRVEAPGLPTVLHAQDLVEQGIRELGEATSGDLLNHPVFKRAVEEVIEELARDDDTDTSSTASESPNER
jgi:hypothetical protein